MLPNIIILMLIVLLGDQLQRRERRGRGGERLLHGFLQELMVGRVEVLVQRLEVLLHVLAHRVQVLEGGLDVPRRIDSLPTRRQYLCYMCVYV